MIHPKLIIPECDADTFFLETIKELKPRSTDHGHGASKVLRKLNDLNAPKALGIIDKDPHAKFKPDLTTLDYQLISDDNGEGFLKLYRHSNERYHVIEINKEFEYWLYHKVIPESGISFLDYDLPENWKEFCDYFKGEEVRTKGKIQQFFKALKKSDSASLKLYISWIEECTQ